MRPYTTHSVLNKKRASIGYSTGNVILGTLLEGYATMAHIGRADSNDSYHMFNAANLLVCNQDFYANGNQLKLAMRAAEAIGRNWEKNQTHPNRLRFNNALTLMRHVGEHLVLLPVLPPQLKQAANELERTGWHYMRQGLSQSNSEVLDVLRDIRMKVQKKIKAIPKGNPQLLRLQA